MVAQLHQRLKINVFWNFFFTLGSLLGPFTRINFKNGDFNLWDNQCIVLPKWTFFRVLANYVMRNQEKLYFFINRHTFVLVSGIGWLCWKWLNLSKRLCWSKTWKTSPSSGKGSKEVCGSDVSTRFDDCWWWFELLLLLLLLAGKFKWLARLRCGGLLRWIILVMI